MFVDLTVGVTCSRTPPVSRCLPRAWRAPSSVALCCLVEGEILFVTSSKALVTTSFLLLLVRHPLLLVRHLLLLAWHLLLLHSNLSPFFDTGWDITREAEGLYVKLAERVSFGWSGGVVLCFKFCSPNLENLVVTSATLVVTGALLVVTRS